MDADALAEVIPIGETAFWAARPELEQLHTFAAARRTAPWAVLGNVLARVVATTEPNVVLPPIVGGYASLNLFVGIVGASGDGKGAAAAVAAEYLSVPDGDEPEELMPGSGEGLAHMFALRRKGGEQETVRTRALLSVDEIDNLTALSQRRGATLLPELRKAWSGEPLGFGYSDPTKRLTIGRHRYRLCLTAGIQPARAGALLDDADGGTPQRFLWLPASDPDAPDIPPGDPGPFGWCSPYRGAATRQVLTVSGDIRREVDAERLSRLRGGAQQHSGHDTLARLKMAAALALLASRTSVGAEDWHLAGIVAQRSAQTRHQVHEVLAKKAAETNRRAGEAEAERELVKEARKTDSAALSAVRALRRALTTEWQPRNKVRGRLNSRYRGSFDDAVERLLQAGELQVDDAESGTRFRLMAQ